MHSVYVWLALYMVIARAYVRDVDFSRGDMTKIQHQIASEKDITPENRELIAGEFEKVTQYCQNGLECRRLQVLRFFDEDFDPAHCRKMCDNCRNPEETTSQDFTSVARDIVKLVQDFKSRRERVTFIQLESIFEGTKKSVLAQKGWDKLPYCGAGKNHPKGVMGRLINKLVSDRILRGKLVVDELHGRTNEWAEVKERLSLI